MKALLIDHDDSFTFNLREWLRALTTEIVIINHREISNQTFEDFNFVVLSAGPKNPHDYPHILNWLRHRYFAKPIFGVCLGMQLFTVAAGGNVEKYSPPLHGKKSKLHIQFNPSDQLHHLSNIEVARYHSLKCINTAEFNTLAFSEEIDGQQTPMWIEHKTYCWMGLQFHPESFMTENKFGIQQVIQQWIAK